MTDEHQERLELARQFRREVRVGWDDVAGLVDAKRAVASALALMLAKPPAGVRNDPVLRLLFFGPPGTGKTLLAAATSTLFRLRADRPAAFYAAKVSELRSAEIITALFTILRQSAPAVSFYDEVEAIALRRGSEMDQSPEQRKMLSTLLSELDGFGDKGVERPWILHIAATNRPWDLDPAILSRFTRRIYVPLPDDELRRAIIEIEIRKNGHRLNGVDWRHLLDKTHRFSGREIETLAQRTVASMIDAENPDIAELAVRDPERLRRTELRVRPLGTTDFLEILSTMKPLTSPEQENRFTKWARAPFSVAP